jgi:hypothetical protein
MSRHHFHFLPLRMLRGLRGRRVTRGADAGAFGRFIIRGPAATIVKSVTCFGGASIQPADRPTNHEQRGHPMPAGLGYTGDLV